MNALRGSDKNGLDRMEPSVKNAIGGRPGRYLIFSLITPVAGWLLFWLCAQNALAVANGLRVAVFDFDKRTRFPDALGRHIEDKLMALDRTIAVVHYTAEGDETRAVKILSDLDRGGFDLIIVRTSDALIIAQHTILKTPTLYTNVNNPKILGFQTLGPPGGNISGASYYIPIENHLAVYKTIVPSLKKLGFLFDRHNQSRKAEVPEARTACADLGLTFDSEFIKGSDQLPEAVRRLIKRGADGIVVASSGMIYENIRLFLDITNSARIPVFSFYKAGVSEGAVAALSSDYFQMADKLLIPMARKVLLEKVWPGDMPAAFLKQKKLFINTCQAKNVGLTMPTQALIENHGVELEEICQ
jgi:putative ABC transport system substrate-binding protein